MEKIYRGIIFTLVCLSSAIFISDQIKQDSKYMGIKVELQIWEAKWIPVLTYQYLTYIGIGHTRLLCLLLNLKACGICQSLLNVF